MKHNPQTTNLIERRWANQKWFVQIYFKRFYIPLYLNFEFYIFGRGIFLKMGRRYKGTSV